MARRPAIQTDADSDKEAMLACSSLLASLMPAADKADADFPPIREAIGLHDAAAAHQQELLRSDLSWVDTLAHLSAWVERHPTPVADVLRRQAI